MPVYLKEIKSITHVQSNKYPFDISSFWKGIDIIIKKPILILVGEN